MMVHLLVSDEGDEPSQVGFVVSKAIGNAVQRNLVKRRLRHAALDQIAGLPPRTRAVVRALPPAAGAPFAELSADLASCLTRALARATGPGGPRKPASGSVVEAGRRPGAGR